MICVRTGLEEDLSMSSEHSLPQMLCRYLVALIFVYAPAGGLVHLPQPQVIPLEIKITWPRKRV